MIKQNQSSSQSSEFLLTKGLSIGELLGSGAYGRVYKATRYDLPVAIKVMWTLGRRDTVLTELSTIQQLYHPNIIQFLDIFQYGKGRNSHQVFIVMEMAKTDLYHYLDNEKIEKQGINTYRFYLQISDAIGYLHQIGFAHSDLKLENVLLDETLTVCKVADFGMTKKNFVPRTGMAHNFIAPDGTLDYAPPELLEMIYNGMKLERLKAELSQPDLWFMRTEEIRNYILEYPHEFGFLQCPDEDEVANLANEIASEEFFNFSFKTISEGDPFALDVWSLGVILWCLVNKHPKSPFHLGNDTETQFENEDQLIERLALQSEPLIYLDESISQETVSFIGDHLVYYWENRPSIFELRKHPWMFVYYNQPLY